MGRIFDALFPPYNGAQMQLAADITPDGETIRRVPNPPNVTPTSPLTEAISVVSAVDASYGVVSRKQFLSIPAARGALNLMAGVAGSFPFHTINKDQERVVNPFLSQPERAHPRVVSYTRLAAELLLEGAALWRVTARYADRFPKNVELITKSRWSQDPQTGFITIDGKRDTKQDDLILFPAPFEGLLSVCSQSVRNYLQIRRTVNEYLSNPQAREYFQATEGQELTADQIRAFLSDWRDARRRGVTAFIPAGVELKYIEQMTPAQLMLKEAEEAVIADFARMMNVDPSWMGLSITTRQYSNIQDERRNFLEFVVMPQLVTPMEQRMSMGDITPNGSYVKANLDHFLRANTLERYQTYQIADTIGLLSHEEMRGLEDRPPLPGDNND